jgi:hypothetical protein
MSKIRTFLKGLIGRAKEYMGQLLLTFGGIMLPFGLYMLAEHPESPAIWVVATIVGLIFWILAGWYAEKKDAQERKDNRKVRELLTNIHKELQELNKGMRERNEL